MFLSISTSMDGWDFPRGKGAPPEDKAVLEFKRKTTGQANEKKRLLPGEGRGRRERKASHLI